MITVDGDLTIGADSTLSLHGDSLTVTGTLTIEGTFEPGCGTVTMTGLTHGIGSLSDTFRTQGERFDYSELIGIIKRLMNDRS